MIEVDCNYTKIKEKGWHYCTGPKVFGVYLIPDNIFGVPIGCPCCKAHDVLYANDIYDYSRSQADDAIRACIYLQFIKKGYPAFGFWVSWAYWLFCRAFGMFYWKKWGLKGVQKYI